MSRRRSSSFATAKVGSPDANVAASMSSSSILDQLDQESLEAAHQLWELVFYAMDDPRTRQTILHSTDNVCLVQAILDRSLQLDYLSKAYPSSFKNKKSEESAVNWLSEMLKQMDGESGYTPLHWAVLKAKVPILLLILRYIVALGEQSPNNNPTSATISTAHLEEELRSVTTNKRLTHRPLALLQGDIPNNLLSEEAKAILNAKDGEGLTAFQLLEQLQVRELEQCRKSLVFYPLSDPAAAAAAEPGQVGRGRQNSFDIMLQQQDHRDQNELADLHDFMDREQQQRLRQQQSFEFGHSQPHQNGVSYACEVLAFGRSNHLALGVQGGAASSSTSKASASGADSSTSRPQRVQEFAQDRVGRDGSAVAVAAAAHHTLVATRNGHLYAFGVGTGGRLGTGEKERHCPAPTRVLGALEKRRVVAVAAAENHSLCVTSEGAVYAFGSNRFGQLGYTTTDSGDKSGSTSRCCLPRRVDDLWKKNVLCVSVAAGEKHSVALSKCGEVYVWGCNAAGQLGVSHRRSSSNSGMAHKVQRVDALWNNERKKVCIQIAASAQSTLVLAKPNTGGLPVNQVYAWGHGNHVPSKVHFSVEQNAQQDSDRLPQGNSFSSSASRRGINPVAIACARFHNAAITADGRVYTWGFHAEPLGGSSSQLGTSKKSTKTSGLSPCSCPQLVSGMLPEEGGGVAIAIAASENHTAVVTNEGALFTWGASYGKDVLGHEGVRWQPRPKRVSDVSRAVGLAAAKEHTVLLVGASFPPMVNGYNENSASKVPSLEHMAAQEAAKHVDLFNALPMLMMAERTSCLYLEEYCHEFIRLNFDGVLNMAQKSVMDTYLKEELATGLLLLDEDARDRRHRPCVMDIVLARPHGDPSGGHSRESETVLSDPLRWVLACRELAMEDSIQSLVKRINSLQLENSPVAASTRGRPRSSSSVGSKSEALKSRSSSFSGATEDTGRERSASSTDRCQMLTTNMDLSTEALAQAKHASLSKEIRGLKKKLNQIAKLENLSASEQADSGILSAEQLEKIARRPQLESELSIFEPALRSVEKSLADFNCKTNQIEAKPSEAMSLKGDAEEGVSDTAGVESLYRCVDCKITCPDEKSYSLHMNGRKHRNRIAQLEEEEKKQAADKMIEQRHRQQLEAMLNPSDVRELPAPPPSAWSNSKPQRASATKYNLPPPPSSTQEFVDDSQKAFPAPPSTKSLKEIMEEEQKAAVSRAPKKKVPSAPRSQLQLPAGSAPTINSPPWGTKAQVALGTSSLPKYQSPSPVSKTRLTKTPPIRPSPGSAPVLKSPPWATKPVNSPLSVPSPAQVPAFPSLSAATAPSPKSTSSFGEFLKKAPITPPPQRPRASSAPWANAAPPSKPRPIGELNPDAKNDSAAAAAAAAVRFQEIQKQEEAFKSVQDQSYSDNGKWFIERRERAGSFATIQELAAQEEEERRLIEEQKLIEAQIQRDLAIQKKREEQKKRQKAKKAQQKAKNKNVDQGQAKKGGMQQQNEPQNKPEQGGKFPGVPSKSNNKQKRRPKKHKNHGDGGHPPKDAGTQQPSNKDAGV